jgi:hypothetical protein
MTTIRTRLIVLAIALPVLIAVGAAITGGFSFVLGQFWFTAGLFLLLLMSLIDQPLFSKDANVFLNGVTGGASLLLVDQTARSWLWWLFLAWCAYLVFSSYLLMWARSRPLAAEPMVVRVTSRVNRQIGRPEAVFSALFLWGAVLQFGESSHELSALFLFWAIYMVLDLPAVVLALSHVRLRHFHDDVYLGVVENVTSPRVADLALTPEAPTDLIGADVAISMSHGTEAARGVIIDDRIVAGRRIGRLAITSRQDAFRELSSTTAGTPRVIRLERPDSALASMRPTSVVDVGSEIGKIVFHVHPDLALTAGELVKVRRNDSDAAFYQAVAAVVSQRSVGDGNQLQTVKVTAGQVGLWSPEGASFEPITWVVPAGELVYRATSDDVGGGEVPAGCAQVGVIPKSDFPVHVRIGEIVTHNTAVIGITGSGKSYLAFHMIESMAEAGIQVLILDMSRQHDVFLSHLKPRPLHQPSEVADWIASGEPIGIHQFALDKGSLPKTTSAFVESAFVELAKARLVRGKNHPPRLCIVFEEAHSLIPEWNQVADKEDVGHVNKTARLVLQGRKFGMGCLVISQRTANVTKTILNQCSTIFALQSYDQTGLDFLRNYMGEEYSQAISTLARYNAVLVGKASSSHRPLIFQIPDWSSRWTEAGESEPLPASASPTAEASE